MKKLIALILLIIIVFACSQDKQQKFSVVPEKPETGNEISINFIPDKENLKNVSEMEMLVYSFGVELLNTSKVVLTKDKNTWTGKFKIDNETKGLIAKFKSGEIFDDNDQLGYVIPIYDKDKNELVGFKAGLGNIYQRWASAISLKKDSELANKYFKEEFAKHPELKGDFLNGYVSSFPKNKIDSAASAEIELIEEKDNLSQNELEFLANWTKNLGDHVKSLKYVELIEKEYPQSNLVKSKYYTKFRNMLTIEKKLNVFNEYVKIDKDSDLLQYMLSSIVSQQVKENKISNAEKMLSDYTNMTNSNIYNGIAWRLFETKKNLKDALKYSEKGIELARKEVENPTGKKPPYVDESEWKTSKKNSLAMILDTYGNIQSELGNNNAAVKSFEEAVQITESDMSEINESYISALFKLGDFEKVKQKAEQFISAGKSTNKMKEILKEAFIKTGGSKDNVDKYLGEINASANENMKEKLKSSIMNKPAPKFTLKDLKGNPVSLADFKGQTVIVDFWATWCGPCLQSFPIMEKAVNKFGKERNVKFLFVNTWERVDDKLKNATDFIAKNKYPFHVLLDDKNEVIDSYGVEGIPTKFIIDKNGNIRFKSVGLEGTEDEILAELDQMITLVQ